LKQGKLIDPGGSKQKKLPDLFNYASSSLKEMKKWDISGGRTGIWQ
jgi:hypothetical protein